MYLHACLQVLSVYETKLPYCLDPHTLETIGLETFNGAATLKAMAAHFRLDMVNKVHQQDTVTTKSYCIAGNFRGRITFTNSTFWEPPVKVSSMKILGVPHPVYNCMVQNSMKVFSTKCFHEVFSPKSFPLYSMYPMCFNCLVEYIPNQP